MIFCILLYASAALPSFNNLWNDPVTKMSPREIENKLGGNLKGLSNYCCVRVSHALISASHPITRESDYKDKNGNKYIIRVKTMKEYLTNKYGSPIDVTKETAKGKRGIIIFDVSGWSDATGHADLWDGNNCAYQEYWNKASKVHLWECH